MNGTIPRLLTFDFLLLLCLALPACQHQSEPYSSVPALDPKITVVETPPKPLPTDLVCASPLPVPVQPSVVARQESILEPPPIQLVSQPPAILPPSITHAVSQSPKRSGLAIALDHFLQHRNDDAIVALKQYQPDDQDAALVMLPLLARIDEGEIWTTMNGPQKQAILESLRSLCKRLSKSAPLLLQHVTFVDKPPSRFGEVKPRTNANYYPEDYVCTYAELVNLQDFINPEGLYNVRLEVTLDLRGPDDKVYWNDSRSFQKEGSIGPRSDYHVAASFPLPKQLAPGSYQLVITVLDRDTNRSARQVLPLQVLDSHNKSNSTKRKG